VFAFQLNSKGDVTTTGLLVKEQIGGPTSFQFGSFRLFHSENRVFAFYQDNPKNVDVSPIEKGKTRYTNSYSDMFKVELTESGFTDKEMVYSSKKDKLRTPMHKIFRLQNGDLLFCEEAKDVNRLRVFTFD
jgi:hypothetical protein